MIVGLYVTMSLTMTAMHVDMHVEVGEMVYLYKGGVRPHR